MAHKVKCYYCGITFDRDKLKECCQVNSKRWAHTACHERAQAEKNQNQKDLEEYLLQIFEALTSAEKDVIPTLDSHYPSTPDWFSYIS